MDSTRQPLGNFLEKGKKEERGQTPEEKKSMKNKGVKRYRNDEDNKYNGGEQVSKKKMDDENTEDLRQKREQKDNVIIG